MLFLDIFIHYTSERVDRIFTRSLIEWLNRIPNHAWAELSKGRAFDEIWLARQLRPYGIRPRLIRIGEDVSRGYLLEDFMDSFRRYISRTEFAALTAEMEAAEKVEQAGDGVERSEP